MTFAAVGIILFPDVHKFSDFGVALLYLFEASLGSFDSSIFESMETKNAAWGYYYQCIFLLASLVLLLNLLIAILSNTYSELQPRSKALYFLEMAKLNNTKRWDPKYGALISAPPYVDLLLIPFIPFLVMSRNPRRLNNFLYFCEYMPALALSVVIFICMDLVVTPFAIFCALVTKCSLLFSPKTDFKWRLLLDLAFYLVSCIPLHAYHMICRFPSYILGQLSCNLRRKEKKPLQEISM